MVYIISFLFLSLQTAFINGTEYIIIDDKVYKSLDSSTMSVSIEHYVTLLYYYVFCTYDVIICNVLL